MSIVLLLHPVPPVQAILPFLMSVVVLGIVVFATTDAKYVYNCGNSHFCVI